jgi:hypothetical protein
MRLIFKFCREKKPLFFDELWPIYEKLHFYGFDEFDRNFFCAMFDLQLEETTFLSLSPFLSRARNVAIDTAKSALGIACKNNQSEREIERERRKRERECV